MSIYNYMGGKECNFCGMNDNDVVHHFMSMCLTSLKKYYLLGLYLMEPDRNREGEEDKYSEYSV